MKKLTKLLLSSNDDKIIQSTDLIETYTKGLVYEIERKLKWNNIIK